MRASIRVDSLSNPSDNRARFAQEPLKSSFSDGNCIKLYSPCAHEITLPNRNQLSLWLGNLEASEENLNLFSSYLSPNESERAQKYKRKQDVLRCIIARGTVRSVLSSMLSEKQDEIRIACNEHGKPILSDHPTLQFNLSHSGDQMLLGVSHTVQLGVDIEFIDKTTNVMQIAKRHYAEAECQSLEGCDDNSRAAEFFEIWTRKEAYIKATGLGLGHMLNKLPTPAQAVADRWVVENIATTDGYSAAFAAQKHTLEDDLQITYARWSWT